jgi:hypothetical protein
LIDGCQSLQPIIERDQSTPRSYDDTAALFSDTASAPPLASHEYAFARNQQGCGALTAQPGFLGSSR